MSDKPTPLREPNTCPSGYTIDLYCKYEFSGHAFDEFPASYFGTSSGDVRRQARGHGWILHNDDTATCPKCKKALNP